ncbi:MAG: DMT family transporter [Pseudomonadota bacterium]
MTGATRQPAGAATTAPGHPALWLTLVMGVGFAVIWSSAFSVGKILVTEVPPFTVSALRFALSAVLAGALACALGQRLPRGREAWRAILILGTCQNTLYLGFFFNAMTLIPAGLASILASAMPLVVAALAPLMIGERIGGVRATGLILGFGGVLWIMGTRLAGGIDPLGVGIAITGTLGLALATLTIKKGDFGTGLLMVVACQMAVGTLGCALLALALEDVTAWALTPDNASLLVTAFLFQVLVPGIGATLLWFTLVKRVSAAGASSFHFLNPAFGVAFAWVLLGETVGWTDGLGVVLVAAGILLVNRAGRAA